MKSKFLIVFIFVVSLSLNALALEKPGEELKSIGAFPKLGKTIDIDSKLTDENGKEITIKSFLEDNKPIILVPAYFRCPSLCGLVHKGISKLINNLKLSLNSDYQVLTYSFDPKETYELAKAKSKNFKKTLTVSEEEKKGWHFLVGENEVITKLNQQLGFSFKKDKGEYAHSAVAYIITPAGKISQYFTGITFAPFDLKLALLEAAEGRIGSAFDRVLLYCFRFDPTKGKYTWAAFGLMRAGGVLTLIFLVWLLVSLWRKEGQNK